jgi:alanyl-tRNA synthetase
MTEGSLKVGDEVACAIDTDRRKAIARAHSATHLLDAALRKVLGDHVHQAGSLVEPDRLRFDFTHFNAITAEELDQVSRLVNDEILEGLPVVTRVMPIEEAQKLGATALFGEKYGKVVRVVSMGDLDQPFSMEFCGGTHLDNTAKVGPFHIRSESSVASGVRRIEATVGRESLNTMNRNQELLFRARRR